MDPILLNHTFNQTLTLHSHIVLFEESNRKPTTSQAFEAWTTSHDFINMRRYNFYDEGSYQWTIIDDFPEPQYLLVPTIRHGCYPIPDFVSGSLTWPLSKGQGR
jgi:hypothetical protein